MKRTLTIVLCFAGLMLVAQSIPEGLRNVSNNFYQTTDGQLWLNKGVQYGWVRVARFSDIPTTGTPGRRVDGKGNTIWARRIITATNGNQISLDDDNVSWYWVHTNAGVTITTPVTVSTTAGGDATITVTSTGQIL